MNVRKLILTGEIPGRGKKVSSYFSWPAGESVSNLHSIIHRWRNNYDKVTVVIQQ